MGNADGYAGIMVQGDDGHFVASYMHVLSANSSYGIKRFVPGNDTWDQPVLWELFGNNSNFDCYLRMEKRGPDIIKLVTLCDGEEALLEGFRTMRALKREVRTPVSFHLGGKAGSMSRIVNPMLGGHMIFCVDRYGENSTMDQLDLRTARTVVDSLRKML